MTLVGYINGQDCSSGLSFTHAFMMEPSVLAPMPAMLQTVCAGQVPCYTLTNPEDTRTVSSDPRARHSVAPQLHPRGLTALTVNDTSWLPWAEAGISWPERYDASPTWDSNYIA